MAFGFVVPCDGIILSSLVEIDIQILRLLNSIIVVAHQIWSQYRINQWTIHRMLPSIWALHFHLRIVLISLNFARKDVLIRGIKNLLIITGNRIISDTFIFALVFGLELVSLTLAGYVNWSMHSLAAIMGHIRRLVCDQMRHFNIVQVWCQNSSVAILESSESRIWLLGQTNLLHNHSTLRIWVDIIIGSVTSCRITSTIWLNCWDATVSNLCMRRISGLWYKIRIETCTIILFGGSRN